MASRAITRTVFYASVGLVVKNIKISLRK